MGFLGVFSAFRIKVIYLINFVKKLLYEAKNNKTDRGTCQGEGANGGTALL